MNFEMSIVLIILETLTVKYLPSTRSLPLKSLTSCRNPQISNLDLQPKRRLLKRLPNATSYVHTNGCNSFLFWFPLLCLVFNKSLAFKRLDSQVSRAMIHEALTEKMDYRNPRVYELGPSRS